jgi:hypothetical protein
MRPYAFKIAWLIRKGYILEQLESLCISHTDDEITIDEDDARWAALRDETIARRESLVASGTVGPLDLSCVHRLGKLVQCECAGCSGNVRLFVFGCEIHGRCTIDRACAESPPMVCSGCADRKSGTTGAIDGPSKPARSTIE